MSWLQPGECRFSQFAFLIDRDVPYARPAAAVDPRGSSIVDVRCQRQAEPGQSRDDASPQNRRAMADAAGKDDMVETANCRGHGRDGLRNPDCR